MASGLDLGHQLVASVKLEGVITAPDVVSVDEDVGHGPLATLLSQSCLDSWALSCNRGN